MQNMLSESINLIMGSTNKSKIQKEYLYYYTFAINLDKEYLRFIKKF